MSDATKIEWTDHTFNPWWGCTEVAAECDNCYARTFSKRVGHKMWGTDAPRRFFGDKHWEAPLKWNARAERDGVSRRVFCASMADVFELGEPLDRERDRLWALIRETPWLDWQLLTKRPGNIRRLVPEAWREEVPRNVWLGTTAGTQKTADNAIPKLDDAPMAMVKFLSIEPLLEELKLGTMLHGIDWVIIGGESGPKARDCYIEWMRSVAVTATVEGCAVFMKQFGAKPCDGSGRLWPITDRKGGLMDDWPGDLRVREFPLARV